MLSAYKKRKIRKKLTIMADMLAPLFPDVRTELYFNNHFQLLVAIIMSAQSTDKQVNKINQKFFEVLKTPEDGVKMGVEKIKSFVRSVAYFNNKSKHIYETCKILSEAGGKIPDTLEGLQKLPGVGVKTAKVFLGVTADAPYLGVDTHVHRVLNRFGIVKTKTPEQTDKVISVVNFDGNYGRLHHTLVLFGRYYSKANDHDFSKSKDPEFCRKLKKKLGEVK
ncbi:MAG: endonuclease III [candidate division SR1 bacterium]|nr:MAG: endonuclease III [candidate division SR1 bacterium]